MTPLISRAGRGTVGLSIVALLLLAGSGQASHCKAVGTSQANIIVDGTYYIFDEQTCTYGPAGVHPCQRMFEYEESNLLKGLQRKDRNVDDTCHGAFEPDRLISETLLPILVPM